MLGQVTQIDREIERERERERERDSVPDLGTAKREKKMFCQDWSIFGMDFIFRTFENQVKSFFEETTQYLQMYISRRKKQLISKESQSKVGLSPDEIIFFIINDNIQFRLFFQKQVLSTDVRVQHSAEDIHPFLFVYHHVVLECFEIHQSLLNE